LTCGVIRSFNCFFSRLNRALCQALVLQAGERVAQLMSELLMHRTLMGKL
jgi:hypothetical protein